MNLEYEANKGNYSQLVAQQHPSYTFQPCRPSDDGLAHVYQALALQPLCSLRSTNATFNEVSQAVESGAQLWSVTYADNFGEFDEPVAFFCTYLHGDNLYVEYLVASPRLFHKGFEAALGAWARSIAQPRDVSNIVLRGKANDHNSSFVREFISVGFSDCPLSAQDHVLIRPVDVTHPSESLSSIEWPRGVSLLNFLTSPLASDISFYLIPHQDDELYTYGLDIVRKLKRKTNIGVILVTDGALSFVRNLLNDGGSCAGLGCNHIFKLTESEFVAARDREFAECCQLLGLPAGNIHYAQQRSRDLDVTIEEGLSIILDALERYPFAKICAHAPRHEVAIDSAEHTTENHPHHDHCMLGRAAEQLLEQGALHYVEFFVEFYDMERFVRHNPEIFLMHRIASADEMETIKRASVAYKRWDPTHGRFAIGWHSVPEWYDWALSNDVIASYDPSIAYTNDIPSITLQEHLQELQDDLQARQGQLAALQAQLLEGQKRLAELETSTTWKVGRAIMALPARAKDALRTRAQKN